MQWLQSPFKQIGYGARDSVGNGVIVHSIYLRGTMKG